MSPELFQQLTAELYERLSIKGVEAFRPDWHSAF